MLLLNRTTSHRAEPCWDWAPTGETELRQVRWVRHSTARGREGGGGGRSSGHAVRFSHAALMWLNERKWPLTMLHHHTHTHTALRVTKYIYSGSCTLIENFHFLFPIKIFANKRSGNISTAGTTSQFISWSPAVTEWNWVHGSISISCYLTLPLCVIWLL